MWEKRWEKGAHCVLSTDDEKRWSSTTHPTIWMIVSQLNWCRFLLNSLSPNLKFHDRSPKLLSSFTLPHLAVSLAVTACDHILINILAFNLFHSIIYMLAYSNTRKHFSTITKCISTIIPSNFIYCVRQSILSVHLITTISFHDASVVPSPGRGCTRTFQKLYCNTSSCQSPGIEVQVHLTWKFTGLLWSVVISPNNICRSTHITQFTPNLHNTSLSTNLLLLKGWLGP